MVDMMENPDPVKKIEAPARSDKGWIAVIVFMAVLAAMTAGITFMRRSAGEMRGPLPTQPPRQAAEATAAPVTESPVQTDPVVKEEPSGGSPAEETASPAPTQQAFSKTAIVVNGSIEAVMPSREAAEELILNVQKHFEGLGDMPRNAITELTSDLRYEEADESAETMSYDEAFTRFTDKDTPLRFVSKATSVEDTPIPHSDRVIVDSMLPKGLRVVRLLGRDGVRRKVFSYTYVNGVLTESGTAEDYTLLEPVDGDVRLGGRVYPDDYEVKPGFGSDPSAAHFISFVPPAYGQIINFYGPYSEGFHHGIDVTSPGGAEVFAAADGTVVSVMERGSYGLMIEIQHEHEVTTRYSKLGLSLVSVGDRVSAGDAIGTVSDEESITHLHFELRVRGTAYNPLKILSKAEIEG